MSLVAFFEIFISSIEIFFTYFSIKFYNLHLKWNILRISLWKWKKWILFYERSSSNIILIKNTKLFFLLGVCIYITYQIKKCVYICMCVCVCVCVEVVLINILVPQLGPPKQKFLAPPLEWRHPSIIYKK